MAVSIEVECRAEFYPDPATLALPAGTSQEVAAATVAAAAAATAVTVCVGYSVKLLYDTNTPNVSDPGCCLHLDGTIQSFPVWVGPGKTLTSDLVVGNITDNSLIEHPNLHRLRARHAAKSAAHHAHAAPPPQLSPPAPWISLAAAVAVTHKPITITAPAPIAAASSASQPALPVDHPPQHHSSAVYSFPTPAAKSAAADFAAGHPPVDVTASSAASASAVPTPPPPAPTPVDLPALCAAHAVDVAAVSDLIQHHGLAPMQAIAMVKTVQKSNKLVTIPAAAASPSSASTMTVVATGPSVSVSIPTPAPTTPIQPVTPATTHVVTHAPSVTTATPTATAAIISAPASLQEREAMLRARELELEIKARELELKLTGAYLFL